MERDAESGATGRGRFSGALLGGTGRGFIGRFWRLVKGDDPWRGMLPVYPLTHDMEMAKYIT
ncbi:MAG: hypothetical protein NT069_06020 [Planctomycetota bacterium]|nr:hypothetical protein [Planctomycetota bacterium]